MTTPAYIISQSIQESLEQIKNIISNLRIEAVHLDLKDEVGNEDYFSQSGHALTKPISTLCDIVDQAISYRKDLEYIKRHGAI